ncbi:MAG TPA: hypothetical protein VFJ89_07325 [Nocardioides sp.]|jgi:hypothetical protein|nr:hypothetical protein [Nocardioides sp.]
MTANPLRLLTLTALATLLVTSPGTASYGALRTPTGGEYVVRTAAATGRTPTTFPTSGLSVGDAPSISYLFASEPVFGGGNWRLVRTDGTTLRTPDLPWGAWAPMGRGAIGMAGTEAGLLLQQVSGQGRVHHRYVDHFGLAVSPDRRIVGWLGDSGAPHVVEGGGSRRFRLNPVPHGRTIATIAGRRTCREQEPEGGGCAVFVNGRHRTYVTTSHGDVSRYRPTLAAADVSLAGRVIGQLSRRTAGSPSCWGLFTARGTRVTRTCHYRLVSFSRDGRRVLAEHRSAKADAVSRFAILGHGGRVLRSWTVDHTVRRNLTQLTWEDDHHLLGVLEAHGTWGVVRVGTDGSVEYAGDPVDAVNEFTPYNLPLR